MRFSAKSLRAEVDRQRVKIGSLQVEVQRLEDEVEALRYSLRLQRQARTLLEGRLLAVRQLNDDLTRGLIRDYPEEANVRL